MSFGIQTFTDNEKLDFDSDGRGSFKVIARRVVYGNTDFSVRLDPPYFFVEMVQTGYSEFVSPVTCYNSGRVVQVRYFPYRMRDGKWSINAPTTILVCK